MLRKLALSAEEGFVLSRLDGATPARNLPALTGLPVERLRTILTRLISEGALLPAVAASPGGAPAPGAQAARPPVAAAAPEHGRGPLHTGPTGSVQAASPPHGRAHPARAVSHPQPGAASELEEDLPTLCGRTYRSPMLIQNIARWSAAPPALIAHLLRQEAVRRQPQLRTLLTRHPNAPADAKRGA